MKRKILASLIMMMFFCSLINVSGYVNDNLSNFDKLELIRNAIKGGNAQWNADFNAFFTIDGDCDNQICIWDEKPIEVDEYDHIDFSDNLPDSLTMSIRHCRRV